MPRVLAVYYVIYVVFFMSNRQLKNKKHNLLSMEKFKKPYKLAKYQFSL
jgi:hypothetical protein